MALAYDNIKTGIKLMVMIYFVSIADGKSCEPITIPMCRDIGYTMTQFPNYMGHQRQDDAGLEIHQFSPLVTVQCSEHLKDFLCAVYVPKCDPADIGEGLVLPLRKLCRMSRRGCAPLMNRFGFHWPRTLACYRFPADSDRNVHADETSQDLDQI